jgi:hypothetical protein
MKSRPTNDDAADPGQARHREDQSKYAKQKYKPFARNRQRRVDRAAAARSLAGLERLFGTPKGRT